MRKAYIYTAAVALLFFTLGKCSTKQAGPARPSIDMEARTISGTLHQCAPFYYSHVVPEHFTKLDTVRGRAAWPFQEIVVVVNGSDTLGFFPID